jgi:hypothetical protein
MDISNSILSKTTDIVKEGFNGVSELMPCGVIIQIGKKGLDIFTYLLDNHTALSLEEYTVNQAVDDQQLWKAIEDVFAKHSVLSNPLSFNSIAVNFKSEVFTLIPSEISEFEAKEFFLQNTQKYALGTAIYTDWLEDQNVALIWSVSQVWVERLNSLLPSHQIRPSHQLTPLIMMSLAIHDPSKSLRAFAHFENDYFLVWVLKGDRLIFANSFEYHFANDIVYFLQLVFQEHRLSPFEDTLHLMGDILAISKVYEVLVKYFGEIEFVPKTGHFTFGPEFDSLLWHRYHDIFSVYLLSLKHSN